MRTSPSPRRAPLPALILTSLALTACVHNAPTPGERLSVATQQYHAHLRWQRFDEAAAFLPPDQRRLFLDHYEESRGDLHITEFEVIRVELTDDQRRAYIKIDLSWYRLPSTRVQTSLIEEVWVFHDEGARWELLEQRLREVDG